MSIYDPKNWYYFVGGDATQVYSSASGTFVSATDPAFIAWKALDAGNIPSQVDTIANLGAALAGALQRPVDAGVLAAYQAALSASLNAALLRVLFNHENRIRTLAGQQQITPQQFGAAIAGLL